MERVDLVAGADGGDSPPAASSNTTATKRNGVIVIPAGDIPAFGRHRRGRRRAQSRPSSTARRRCDRASRANGRRGDLVGRDRAILVRVEGEDERIARSPSPRVRRDVLRLPARRDCLLRHPSRPSDATVRLRTASIRRRSERHPCRRRRDRTAPASVRALPRASACRHCSCRTTSASPRARRRRRAAFRPARRRDHHRACRGRRRTQAGTPRRRARRHRCDRPSGARPARWRFSSAETLPSRLASRAAKIGERTPGPRPRCPGTGSCVKASTAAAAMAIAAAAPDAPMMPLRRKVAVCAIAESPPVRHRKTRFRVRKEGAVLRIRHANGSFS